MRRRIALLLIFLPVAIYAQDATEIVKKSDKKLHGETSKAKMQMKIIRPSWERKVLMKTWTKGREYAMVLITEPPRDEGTAFLKRNQEMWNWVPKVDRVIKLPPSMMSQSWMGSDFTNDDLVKQSSIVTDYHHELLGTEKINGYTCHKIELTPRENAAVVWGRVLLWISEDAYLQMQAKYYDQDGGLINTMKGSDIQTFDGRKLPAKLTMIPAEEPDHKTVLIYEDLQFNMPLEDSFFSIQNMKRLR